MQFGLQVYVLSRSSVFGFSLSALLALVFTALSILRHSLGAMLSSMGISAETGFYRGIREMKGEKKFAGTRFSYRDSNNMSSDPDRLVDGELMQNDVTTGPLVQDGTVRSHPDGGIELVDQLQSCMGEGNPRSTINRTHGR